MKGKYVFDVKGLPGVNKLVRDKALELGCVDKRVYVDRHSQPTIRVNLERAEVTGYKVSLDDMERQYGLQGFERVDLLEFLRIEKPTPKVALALVITDDLEQVGSEVPRMVSEADLKELDFDITRQHVMRAAEQACSALGV